VKQNEDVELAGYFSSVAEALKNNESIILNELNTAQGNSVDLGGYFHVDRFKAIQAMRPSDTFNKIIDQLS
jgi:isocitrate dehydrogenase